MIDFCPCGSQLAFSNCCEPYLSEKILPQTPESLMRSRYSAYTLVKIDYIAKTMTEKAAKNFNAGSAKKWAESVNWNGLTVLDKADCFVTFFARFTYKENNIKNFIYEKSEFKLIDGKWFYIDGVILKPNRNDLCPCGSDKKFKRCCGS